jgi:hypothetical protein
VAAPAWDEWERGASCRAKECIAVAEVWVERTPYCLDHAELVFERMLALEIAPGMGETLPFIEHRRN